MDLDLEFDCDRRTEDEQLGGNTDRHFIVKQLLD